MAGKITDLAALTALADGDLIEVVDVSDTSMAGTGTNKQSTVAVARAHYQNLPSTCEGRLTAVSGNPNPTTNQFSISTMYFTPSTPDGVAMTNGNITLWNGSALVNVPFTELTWSVTFSNVDKVKDLFVDYNSGTPQLVASAEWADTITRTDALAVQSGIIVKSGSPALRWVGTVSGYTGDETADALNMRRIWNAYNAIDRPVRRFDPTDSWTYSSTTLHAMNAAIQSTDNRVLVTAGAATSMIALEFKILIQAASVGNVNIGIGEDSTTTNVDGVFGQIAVANDTSVPFSVLSCGLHKTVPLGLHKYQMLERAPASDNMATFYGDNGDASINNAGMAGFFKC